MSGDMLGRASGSMGKRRAAHLARHVDAAIRRPEQGAQGDAYHRLPGLSHYESAGSRVVAGTRCLFRSPTPSAGHIGDLQGG